MPGSNFVAGLFFAKKPILSSATNSVVPLPSLINLDAINGGAVDSGSLISATRTSGSRAVERYSIPTRAT